MMRNGDGWHRFYVIHGVSWNRYALQWLRTGYPFLPLSAVSAVSAQCFFPTSNDYDIRRRFYGHHVAAKKGQGLVVYRYPFMARASLALTAGR
jgi:hypothetical protein